MNTPDFSGKRILFTGFSMAPGSEALAGYHFAKKHGGDDFTTLYWGDEAYAASLPAEFKKIHVAGNNDFDPKLSEGYDIVFRQNATRPDLVLSPTTTPTNEFFKLCPAPIIAVTGTKGKGTTSSLIAAILEEAGHSVHLLGNIGLNALDNLEKISENDIVVFEISSFQLWDIKRSPKIAVVLMISEDHQDVHNSMEEYIEAKAQIVRYQTPDDVVVHHPTNELTLRAVAKARSERKAFLTTQGAYITDDGIYIEDQKVMNVTDVGLVGVHNLENVTAAITAAWEYTTDLGAISKAVKQFKGLEHRLEEVATKKGVTFYNDSFSAAIPAAVAAIHAFDSSTIVIVGGYDKKSSLAAIADAIVSRPVKKAILIGQTGPQLKQLLDDRNFTDYELDTTMRLESAVEKAVRSADAGDVVVLSPGCASFDMFKNYKERGNQFKEYVHGLDG